MDVLLHSNYSSSSASSSLFISPSACSNFFRFFRVPATRRGINQAVQLVTGELASNQTRNKSCRLRLRLILVEGKQVSAARRELLIASLQLCFIPASSADVLLVLRGRGAGVSSNRKVTVSMVVQVSGSAAGPAPRSTWAAARHSCSSQVSYQYCH